MTTNTITIATQCDTELEADAADISVVVEGTGFFTGHEAFKKAKEVKALVDAILATGLEERQVRVMDVRVNSEGFLGIKASGCRYTLQLREVPAAALSVVVGTIAGHKGANLVALRWRFPRLESVVSELRTAVLAKSRKVAEETASGLGVLLQGVHQHREEVHEPDSERALSVPSPGHMKARSGPGETLGLSLSYLGRVIVSVVTDYHVSAFVEAGA